MNRTVRNAGFLGCLLLSACSQRAPQPPGPVTVNVLTVAAQPVVYYDRYTATTVALSQVNLLPEVQGYITGIFFKEGSHVKRGQKLYEIDRRIYEANYANARDNLKVAEGNLKQAQDDAKRYEYLNDNKAVAKQLYDHAIITLENAQNAHRAAQEMLKNAKTNLNYSVINAPFDGTVGFSQVKLGDLVTVGQTVLITISTDDPMGVDFLINEKQLSDFRDLWKDTHSTADSIFTLILPDNSVYNSPGSMSVIDRSVNPQTGSVRIRLLFPNPHNDLRAGMSCVVRIRNQDSHPQLVIPNRAVVEEMGEFFVYVAKDTTMSGPGDGTKDRAGMKADHSLYAFQKKVKLGMTIPPNIIIQDGIGEGDVIVVDGVQSLHNGSRIAISGQGGTSPKGKDGGGRQVN